MEVFMIRLWIIGALYITFWSFGAETTPYCDPEKQYAHSGKCCSKCKPGTYMTKRCIFSVDTVCSPCGPNEYMSVWNDDLKCALHMVCDAGKALQVLHNGNSTYPRECVCIDGHHFYSNEEICMENTNCPPGFGVQTPVQRNKNTVCIQCQEGYFSNTSSTTEQCHPWTNCSEFGLQEIEPGTNISDAVCDHLKNTSAEMIILISVLIVTLAVLLLICIWCYMTKYNTLKAPQDWMRETCDKLSGSEKKSQYREAKTTEPIYTIIKNTNIVENFHSGNLKEIETPRGRLIPMEDEYLDQRRSPEPENGSIVAGMESLSDLESGSLGTSHAYSDTSSDRLLFPNEEVTFPPCPEHHCSQSAKEAPRNRTEDYCIPDPVDKNYGQHSSRHEFHIYPQPYYHMPEKNTDKEPCSCFTNAQYTRSSSKNSTDNMSSPGTPPTPSGNVTGNNNTTVISSAPVMNIKTDMVVVYYSGVSQDAHAPCENEENIKRPMQEERQDHCDSFVANTPLYNYNDVPCCSMPDTDCQEAEVNLRDSNCPVTSSQDLSDVMYYQNTDFLPVQEEGKPEFYHIEVI